jgi:lactate permease
MGPAWPFFAPFIGALGTFVTGSATSSNILFSGFQEATATSLALPVGTLQGAQNFGAAVGNMACPHNIIAGGATVGLAGREGEILRTTAIACLTYTAAGGLLLAWLV